MARKRKSAGASDAPRSRRLNCALPEGLCLRLGAYASWRGETIGAVVTRAVETELARVRFTVYCAPGHGSTTPSPAPAEAPEIAPEAPEGVQVPRAGQTLRDAS